MTKLSKIRLIVLGVISLIIIGGFLMYKDYREDLKIRCTSDSKNNDPNLSYILVCMERANLYRQEQYDAYYNIAANNPPLSIIQDDIFYQGFSTAYRNCVPFNNICNSHNNDVMNEFMLKCTQNAKKGSFCTDDYFSINSPNQENVKYFINVMQKKIERR